MNKDKLENEVMKELDIEIEKNKLQDVLDIINNEILAYIDKRKQVSEQILKYREKALEEFKDDEDKVAEYFDHEKFVKEESFKLIDRKLKELMILKDIPYFGRVDFWDIDFDEEDTICIGRFGVTPQNMLEPVVVDWRSPVSALFYSSKLGKSSYTAPVGEINVKILKKRQYIIKKQELIGLFDSEADVKDEILQMVLSSNTGDKLKDIVMSIQEEQDNIIRQPRYEVVVVDGVAGSGKTTIALHRVAYLLYNYRDVLQDKVLIIGPNTIFMEYISQVLPSLGEVGVFQTTFLDFALDLIEVNELMDFKEYMENVVNEKGDFISIIEYKNSSEYISKLDSYIEDLNERYFICEDVVFDNETVIDKKEIEKLFKESFASMPLFKRNKRIKRIIFSKLKDIRDVKFREIDKEFKEAIATRTKAELEETENELIFQRKNKIRELIRKVIELKRSLVWLESDSVEKLYNDFNENKVLTIDDLAPILYLKVRLEGIKSEREIKHVVIDEAQDYSELQFKVIREITGCSGYTIVGDRNQRIIPGEKNLPFNRLSEIFSKLQVNNFKLNKSYRSTAEIMKYANKYLQEEKVVPLVRQGSEVEEFYPRNREELKEQILNKIREYRDKEYETIGIICENIKETEYIGGLIKEYEHVNIVRNEKNIFGKGIIILPVYFAKGLEFDTVVITQNQRDIIDNKVNYIMATRALHQLSVFKYI